MEQSAFAIKPKEKTCKEQKEKKQIYHSVEFSLKELSFHYQFKIWSTESMPMCVLVKEDSDILKLLNVGDKLNVQYYSPGSVYASGSLVTTIRQITRSEQGRFKGHFLVGLEILGGAEE